MKEKDVYCVEKYYSFTKFNNDIIFFNNEGRESKEKEREMHNL